MRQDLGWTGADHGGAVPDAIVFSSVDWDFVWQGQQEITVRLASSGARVLYVENTASRSPRAGDLGRIARRLARWTRGAVRHEVTLPSGVTIFSPLVAPYPWRSWSRLLNRQLFVGTVRRLSRALTSPSIWTFLPTPTVIDAIAACRAPGSVVIYYCVTDFAEVVNDRGGLRRAEERLLAQADLVFVNGEHLRQRFQDRHPRVRVYPFGVDATTFSPDRADQDPADLSAIPPPRVGYVGGLHRHLATEWIAAAARALPNVSFVLVGPAQIDTGPLSGVPNVHLLGQRPHPDLPGYMASFDVCLIPYRLTAYTTSVVPTKLFEYLAMGKPVVSSPLPEVLSLRPPEHAVRFAGYAEEFASAVQEQLERAGSGTDQEAAARRAFALRYSWDYLFPAMLRDIVEARRGRAT